MTQKVCTDPYARVGTLAPQVRSQAFKPKKLEELLNGAGGKPYKELFQDLISHLKEEMESAFSADPQLRQLQDKLTARGETIQTLAEDQSRSPQSMNFIEQKLKNSGVSTPSIFSIGKQKLVCSVLAWNLIRRHRNRR